MNMWWSMIMNMQSQGCAEWVIFKYQLSVGLKAKAGFWSIEMMTKTQYCQNNIEPLNMTQYWYPYCHLCEMVDKSIECIIMSWNKA